MIPHNETGCETFRLKCVRIALLFSERGPCAGIMCPTTKQSTLQTILIKMEGGGRDLFSRGRQTTGVYLRLYDARDSSFHVNIGGCVEDDSTLVEFAQHHHIMRSII